MARLKQEDLVEFFRKFFTVASLRADDRWLIEKRRSEGVGWGRVGWGRVG